MSESFLHGCSRPGPGGSRRWSSAARASSAGREWPRGCRRPGPPGRRRRPRCRQGALAPGRGGSAGLGGRSAAFLPVGVMQREVDRGAAPPGAIETLDRGRHARQQQGSTAASPYFDARDEDWDRVIDSNLKAVHWGCQVFGRHMASNGGGSILNVASVSAHLPLSRVFAYSASKTPDDQPDPERRPRPGPDERPGPLTEPPASSRPSRPARSSTPPGSRRSWQLTLMDRFGEPQEPVRTQNSILLLSPEPPVNFDHLGATLCDVERRLPRPCDSEASRAGSRERGLAPGRSGGRLSTPSTPRSGRDGHLGSSEPVPIPTPFHV